MICISRDSKGFLSHLIKHAQLQGSVKCPAKISTGNPISILHKTFSKVHSHHIDIIYFRQLIRFSISKYDTVVCWHFEQSEAWISLNFGCWCVPKYTVLLITLYSMAPKCHFSAYFIRRLTIFLNITFDSWT